jgi:hypothetical protein
VGTNNATLENGASYAPGEVGLAFSLSGSNSYVALPNNFFPYPTTGTSAQPFTFEVWFNTTSGGVIFGQQAGPPYGSLTGMVPGLYVGTDGELRAEMFWSGSGAPLTSTSTVTNGLFHHAAVTYDGSDEVLYLDGAAVASTSLFTQTAYASTYYYQFGTGYTKGWPGGNGSWYQFDGLIDEPSLYSRALTAQEVLTIYQAGSAGKCFTNNPAPVFVQQPANQTGYDGNPLTLSGAAMGSPRPEYQWLFNGAPLNGATNPVLVISNFTANLAGAYELVASNAFGTVTSVAATVTNAVCLTPPEGLVSWWPADGFAFDVVGTNNATLMGGASYAPGEAGQAFSFNGTSSYVEVPNSPSLHSSNELTVVGWFKTPSLTPTAQTTYQSILYKGDLPDCSQANCSSREYGLWVSTAGALVWDSTSADNVGVGTTQLITPPGLINPGQWYHFAALVDSTAGSLQIYLNGLLVASAPYSTNGIRTTSGPLTFGAVQGYSWSYLSGQIDEIALFNRALTPGEIAAMYQAGTDGLCFTSTPAPVFVQQPTNETVWLGTPLTIAAAAMGTPRPQYQWLTNGVPLAGATNATLVIDSAATSQSGRYSVVASNTFGAGTSSVATISVVGTDVSGIIVNQTWTSNNSPYFVVGDINIAGLTILPGVKVLFAGNYTFEVDGTLQALGTLAAPILFTGTDGGWQGLFFNAASPGCALINCIIANSVNSGIRLQSTTPLISSCIISNNAASPSGRYGGGGGIWTDSPLALSECSIIGNNVSSWYGYGAGIYSTAPLNLTDCTVSGNLIYANSPNPTEGNAAQSQGAGIWCTANVTLQSCRVVGNSSSAYSTGWYPVGYAGGVDCGGTLTLQNCIISGNSASAIVNVGPSSCAAYGGGVITVQLLATNTVFDHNSSSAVPTPGAGGASYSQGSAIYLYSAASAAQVVNCTIAYNAATANGGNPGLPQGSGIFSAASTPNNVQIVNSIFWGGTPDQLYGPAAVSYSDVQGGQNGIGNINRNPVFLAETNLIIVPGSPCVDAGSTNAIYNDIYFPPSLGGPQNDMGAHGGPGAGAQFRYLLSGQQLEVILLGAVPGYSTPGYTYLIQGSTDFVSWETLEQVQVAQVGDVAYYLEPSITAFPRKFYRLSLAP